MLFLTLAIFAYVVYKRLAEVLTPRKALIMSIVFTLVAGILTATISEILQLAVFTSARGASFADALIDLLGFALGTAICFVVDLIKKINAVQKDYIDDTAIAAFKEDYKKNIFTKDLKEILRYYFWARAEYEIILTDWPTGITQEEAKRVLAEFAKRDHYRECVNLPVAVKVDVYDQITLNFDLFVDYVWENLSDL